MGSQQDELVHRRCTRIRGPGCCRDGTACGRQEGFPDAQHAAGQPASAGRQASQGLVRPYVHGHDGLLAMDGDVPMDGHVPMVRLVVSISTTNSNRKGADKRVELTDVNWGTGAK